MPVNRVYLQTSTTGGGSGSGSLAGDADVALGTPAFGDALIFDGAHWVNVPIPPTWQSGVLYNVGAQVLHNGQFYASLNTHTSGVSFNPANWALLGSGGQAGLVRSAVDYTILPADSGVILTATGHTGTLPAAPAARFVYVVKCLVGTATAAAPAGGTIDLGGATPTASVQLSAGDGFSFMWDLNSGSGQTDYIQV